MMTSLQFPGTSHLYSANIEDADQVKVVVSDSFQQCLQELDSLAVQEIPKVESESAAENQMSVENISDEAPPHINEVLMTEQS